jgi:hypothetical protein
MPMHRDRRETQQSAKRGPPLCGRLDEPAGHRPLLARGTTPRRAALLASGFL